MRHNKYTILEKIGLILLVTGLLVSIITIIIGSFKADILLGIIVLGLVMASIGAVILRK